MANLGGLLNELQSLNAKKNKTKSNKLEINFNDCDITYIYNALQTSPFSKYYLLIDVRNLNEFSELCIYNSINLNIDKIDDMNKIEKLSQIPCNKANNLKFIQSKKIIIYHNNKNSNDKIKINELQKLFINKENIRNCRILSGVFDDFCEKYPFYVVKGDSKQRLAKYPHEIIDNKLYLGDGQQATNENIINDLKITHIANISKEIKCAFMDKIKYIDIKIQDLENEDISTHIHKVVTFIHNALNNENKNEANDEKKDDDKQNNENRVLVHCQYGISRSASMVISYLMFKNKWKFDKAKKFVKVKRPQISPNDGFVKQLKQYQKTIM